MITLDEVTKTYPLGKGSSVTAVQRSQPGDQPGRVCAHRRAVRIWQDHAVEPRCRVDPANSGKVLIDGTNLWDLTDQQQSFLRSQRIGFVFQFPSLLPTLTVLENVILPTVFGSKQEAAQAHDRATQLLQKVGLADKLAAYPRQLSAGQQQRVVIARALMNQPQMLLADEPTSNLDEKTELEIMDLFRDLHTSMGITIVMVTHMRQLVSYGTRAVEMANGQIVNGHAKPVQFCK